MKDNKKSQVAYFMLIGLSIIIAFSFLSYLKSIKEDAPNKIISIDVQPVLFNFENCIKITTYKGIREIGRYGGFSYIKEPYFSSETFKADYAVYNNTITLPLLNETEIYLSNYLKANIPVCVNFTLFKEFEFEDNGIDVNSSFREKSVEITINWNLHLNKYNQNEKFSYHLPATTKEFPIRFLNIYSIVESIAAKSLLDPNYVDVIFLLNQFSNITYSVYNNDTVVYLITDNEVISSTPYYFIFATKSTG